LIVFDALFAAVTLKTELSPWFIPLCLILGLAYAAFLYKKEHSWSEQINWLLASVRFLAVSLLAFLILGPLLDQISFQEEAPIVVLAIDNSESVGAVADSNALVSEINAIQASLNSSGFETRIRTLDDYVDGTNQLRFGSVKTDLRSSLNEISKDFEQQNLAASILISDGIHNYGVSPQFYTATTPIYTLGLGDTIPSQDLSIKRVTSNKVVYQGKRFPVLVDVFNNGYVEEMLNVEIISNGTVIATESISPTGDQQINSLEFLLDAGEIGIRSYQIRLVPEAGESTISNNVRRLFVEVIDSEQKILIAAAAPHPDIKALRSVIEAKEGTEVSLWIDNFSEDFPEGPFDLVIFHELPGFNDLPQEIDHWIDDSNSLFITGTEDLYRINARNPVLTYTNSDQTDQVLANYSNSFDLFQLDETALERLDDYPPLVVPYGSFDLKENSTIMLYQRIGNARTNRPLLSVYNDEERKSAVFSGSGFWKWRLQESALYEEPILFDELFGKLTQFLATTENKTNFSVRPIQERFTTSEQVEFETEVYNELYEKVYDYNISLKIRNEDNEVEEYNYVNTVNGSYGISGITPGVYTYEARTTLNNQEQISRGSFTVEQLALEDIDLTANHQLLRNIAKNSGGEFFKLNERSLLVSAINKLNAKPISRSSEALNPLINNPLWLFALIGLLTIEWFTRKYHGHY
jgi:hypothetical protein